MNNKRIEQTVDKLVYSLKGQSETIQHNLITWAIETLLKEQEEEKIISCNPVLSEVLPLEGEIYPDTEADGIVFCGKCGKQK